MQLLLKPAKGFTFLLSSFILSFIIFSCQVQKQTTDVANRELADFYVYFSSACCGPTSAEPFVEYTENFLLTNKIEFQEIQKVSNLGKEGEYAILLFQANWSENQVQKYYDGLKKIVWKDSDSPSFGAVHFQQNYRLDKLEKYPSKKFITLELTDL